MPRTRRSISPQFKAQAVLDLLTGVSNQAEICRQHQLSPALVARWKAILAPPSARQLQLAEGVEFPERNVGFASLTTLIWRRGSTGRTLGLKEERKRENKNRFGKVPNLRGQGPALPVGSRLKDLAKSIGRLGHKTSVNKEFSYSQSDIAKFFRGEIATFSGTSGTVACRYTTLLIKDL